jgi:hypothetical protein
VILDWTNQTNAGAHQRSSCSFIKPSEPWSKHTKITFLILGVSGKTALTVLTAISAAAALG